MQCVKKSKISFRTLAHRLTRWYFFWCALFIFWRINKNCIWQWIKRKPGTPNSQTISALMSIRRPYQNNEVKTPQWMPSLGIECMREYVFTINLHLLLAKPSPAIPNFIWHKRNKTALPIALPADEAFGRNAADSSLTTEKVFGDKDFLSAGCFNRNYCIAWFWQDICQKASQVKSSCALISMLTSLP